MTEIPHLTEKRSTKPSLGLFIFLTVASLLLWNAPVVSWMLGPIKTFVTTLHELGHAFVCIATGGTVNALTIVSDTQGHAGLTMCKGGMPFFYTQAGYLGTALMGCLFIFLGQFPRMAKLVLSCVGFVIVFGSIFFMGGAIFNQGQVMQGMLSISWGLAIGASLVWAGWKLEPSLAQLLLLFLAVQTALNALTDLGDLVLLSLGLIPVESFSDATRMADMTYIPAAIWSIAWGAVSLVMLGGTIWWCYLKKTVH
ncbi:MAG: M50 family metallopeptidase [Candidatus Melainabacteria bacterium]|nr:M50 family metallopeptidase [Candidatus Melainabacteria bacterium]